MFGIEIVTDDHDDTFNPRAFCSVCGLHINDLSKAAATYTVDLTMLVPGFKYKVELAHNDGRGCMDKAAESAKTLGYKLMWGRADIYIENLIYNSNPDGAHTGVMI